MSEATRIPELFGSLVFNERTMEQYVPQSAMDVWRGCLKSGQPLPLSAANEIADAMKTWALEHGATHFTHWFQPLSGVTAEKHDSFINNAGGGRVMMDFSGKELVRGEPDASSFPNGGLRATFEARGYSAWDPTAFAFIKDGSLCIPTVFCSYSGDALDKKTPLLRSIAAVDRAAVRVLKLFGDDAEKVTPQIGAEQEYFLIDRAKYLQRKDLIYTGRTLFGARPPKGQELADHYFGSIPPRVSAFMAQLDRELWQLGVLAKTEHNEVAPAQHELAPIYTTTNLACDHNQLTMELMKTVAAQHGMACLLHEKPFAGVNGSGKHNNWSISTDTGMNLLEPGGTPYENAQFLLFLCAVIEAVDEYQDLLRVSVASAGNDHRLGANEAPPAIVSMFLGDELTDILHAIESGTLYVGKEQVQMEIGATVLPHFFRDATDRNRTSPFAFTGNKFEFRMLGSAQSIAGPNTVLNTIVADVLGKYADRLEHSAQFQKDLDELIRTVIHDHKRIIFNGNNYSPQWVAEAEQRGLTNLPGTPEALRTLIDPKNIALFTRHGVFTEAEVRSRYAILLENYSKIGHIEALTMIDMVNQEIIPAVVTYQSQLAQLAANKKLAQSEASTALEDGLLKKLSRLSECLVKRTQSLSDCLMEIKPIQDPYQLASAYRERIYPAMTELRCVADNLELICGRDHWPLPSYGDMLFSIE